MKPGLLLAAALITPVAMAQQEYEIVALDAFVAPANGGVFARGINNYGQVVGSYWTPDFSQLRLFTYSLGTGMLDLGQAPSIHMVARGINDAGQIVAFGSPGGGASQAYRYTPGGGYESLSGPGDAEGLGINNHGQVTGWATIDGGEHAFRYTEGIGLENLGGASVGYSINDHGTVTGVDAGNIFVQKEGEEKVVLGQGVGRAINNLDVIAGNTSLTPVGWGGFIFLNGSVQLLGSLGGASEVWDINDRNAVVGNAYMGSSPRAFLWTEQDALQDLNDLLPPGSGWILNGAFGINDRGQIVGDGVFNGRSTAFLLTPIPEPSTWALLALGAGTLLLLRRRK